MKVVSTRGNSLRRWMMMTDGGDGYHAYKIQKKICIQCHG